VAFFLGDAAFLSDSKFRALARRLPDPDDFNSAVGAFFIALAHARRNGVPEVDASEETQSRFIADLIAVGLLTEQGFTPGPFRAWAPSRPGRPSELATKESSVSKESNTTDTPHSVASTPIPSLQLISKREGVQGEREDIEAFLLVRKRLPTPGQQRILDEVLERHDESGPGWAAELILRHPQDPIGAVLAADKAWRAERIDAAIAVERAPKPPRQRGLRDPLLQELAELNRAYYAEKDAT